jgi:hypothetical protein
MRTILGLAIALLIVSDAHAAKKTSKCPEFEWCYTHANSRGEFPKVCDCVAKE